MIEFGQPHQRFAQCGSTNDAAREWAVNSTDPAPSGALVTADFQTRGRGQRGHEWQAEAGQNALMSYVYHVPAGASASDLSQVTAVAAAEALTSFGLEARIKWPNDILLDGAKAGGILVEAAAGIAILGIGINVNQTQFDQAAEFAYPPTSLRLVSQQAQSVESVIEAVSRSLTQWISQWQAESILPIFMAYGKRLAVGAIVRRGEEKAALAGISADGQAVVQLPDGTFAAWATVN